MAELVQLSFSPKTEFLSDIMITAFDADYGGCNYWSAFSHDLVTEASEWRSLYISEIGDRDPDEDELPIHKVDLDVITLGLNRAVKHAEKNGFTTTMGYLRRGILEEDGGEIDSILADTIVQLGLFDEIRYG